MRTIPILAAVTFATPALLAQEAVHVPRIAADTEGNQITQYPFGWTEFRSQIVLDQSLIAPTYGLITSIGFRPDNDNSSAKPQVTLPHVQIEFSHTTTTPAAMQTLFALNRTETPTVVYSGPLTLPAYSPAELAVAPWIEIPLDAMFVYEASRGNLLVDIVATDPAGRISTGYSLDFQTPGGSVRHFGSVGTTANPLPASISVTGTNGNASIVPGGDITAVCGSGSAPAPLGIFVLGSDRLTPAFDLGAIGFAGSTLHVDPVVTDTIYPMPPLGRWIASYALPYNPTLTGMHLYSQALLVDAQAPGGFVATKAQQITIGEAMMHANHVRSPGPGSTGGTLDKTTGGGPVVRLGGPLFY